MSSMAARTRRGWPGAKHSSFIEAWEETVTAEELWRIMPQPARVIYTMMRGKSIRCRIIRDRHANNHEEASCDCQPDGWFPEDEGEIHSKITRAEDDAHGRHIYQVRLIWDAKKAKANAKAQVVPVSFNQTIIHTQSLDHWHWNDMTKDDWKRNRRKNWKTKQSELLILQTQPKTPIGINVKLSLKGWWIGPGTYQQRPLKPREKREHTKWVSTSQAIARAGNCKEAVSSSWI